MWMKRNDTYESRKLLKDWIIEVAVEKRKSANCRKRDSVRR